MSTSNDDTIASGRAAGHVTHDGSPVPVYLAAPAGPGPSLIDEALGEPSDVLELGAGAGRMTRLFVAYGHRVVAVDDDPAMLEHVTGAETVCADLFSLDLGRRFDAVVAASHLINVPEVDTRRRLLQVAAAHLRTRGIVVLERHEPDWAREPSGGSASLGPVQVELRIGEVDARGFDAAVTYRLGQRSWEQPFRAAPADDDVLANLAAEVGLSFDGCLDDERTWVRLRPTTR